MNTLIWVDGILTIHRGKDSFEGKLKKPSFVKGEGFYYEPYMQTHIGVVENIQVLVPVNDSDGPKDPVYKTVTTTTDIPLTYEEKVAAEKYIANYAFPKKKTVTVNPKVMCVDTYGNYLGVTLCNDTHIEVKSAPPGSTYKWINGAWVDSVLIDATTKKYMGPRDNRSLDNSEYAPNTVPDDFNMRFYSYVNNEWVISLNDAKTCRTRRIHANQTEAVKAVTGVTANREDTTYTTQEAEAKAWTADNTSPTPFIDGLLLARGKTGETKQDLVDKILRKATEYTTFYSAMLGKYQKLMTAIEDATTVDEVKLIKW